jgi:hypothetical protein
VLLWLEAQDLRSVELIAGGCHGLEKLMSRYKSGAWHPIAAVRSQADDTSRRIAR